MPRIGLSLIIPTLFASACLLVRNRETEFEPAWLGDPFLDSWDLDVSQSTFRLGPRVQCQTRTYTAVPHAEHFSLDGIFVTGDRMHAEYTARYDGSDFPMTGIPGVNAVSLRRTTPFQTDAIEKEDGRVIAVETRRLSADRQTLTITVKRLDTDRDAAPDSLVFRRHGSRPRTAQGSAC